MRWPWTKPLPQTIHVHVNGAVFGSEAELAEVIVEALRKYERRNGPRPTA